MALLAKLRLRKLETFEVKVTINTPAFVKYFQKSQTKHDWNELLTMFRILLRRSCQVAMRPRVSIDLFWLLCILVECWSAPRLFTNLRATSELETKFFLVLGIYRSNLVLWTKGFCFEFPYFGNKIGWPLFLRTLARLYTTFIVNPRLGFLAWWTVSELQPKSWIFLTPGIYIFHV